MSGDHPQSDREAMVFAGIAQQDREAQHGPAAIREMNSLPAEAMEVVRLALARVFLGSALVGFPPGTERPSSHRDRGSPSVENDFSL